MKINWKVRMTNRQFWIALIQAILLVIQTIANVFGYKLDFGDLGNKLLAVVNSIFSLLVILGILIDPTTDGVADSERAMQYIEPKKYC